MSGEKATTIWDDLRKPFKKESIGTLPKGGRTVDYVGHAAVTDRLNGVAGVEGWNWDPMALDEHGLPALDDKGNFWIKLTIAGVTKLGVGDGSSMKERIGDALRNAAMRFGVALDLWSKEELESNVNNPSLRNEKPTKAVTPVEQPKPHITADQVIELLDLAKAKGYTDKAAAAAFLNRITVMHNFTELTQAQLSEVKVAIAAEPMAEEAPF